MSQKVTIAIGGRKYYLSVQPEEEMALRTAAEKIESLLKELQKNYQINDKQDALAMSALQLVTQAEVQKNEEKEKDDIVLSKIGKIIQSIESEMK